MAFTTLPTSSSGPQRYAFFRLSEARIKLDGFETTLRIQRARPNAVSAWATLTRELGYLMSLLKPQPIKLPTR